MRRRRKKVNGEKLFSIVITCAIVLTLAVGVFSVIKNSQNNSDNQNNVVDLNETKGSNYALKDEETKAETQKSTENITKEVEKTAAIEETKSPTEEELAVASPSGASANYTFSENDTLKWPVKGSIALKYSMDSTVYFKTLGVYKVNPAVLISANVGDSVIAAASGVVESVSKSEETGTTLVIAIGNEYATTYGQLNNVTLKKGDTIVAGQAIGTVAEPTKYYTQEGTNVYFKLTKEGKAMDPMLYLSEE